MKWNILPGKCWSACLFFLVQAKIEIVWLGSWFLIIWYVHQILQLQIPINYGLWRIFWFGDHPLNKHNSIKTSFLACLTILSAPSTSSLSVKSCFGSFRTSKVKVLVSSLQEVQNLPENLEMPLKSTSTPQSLSPEYGLQNYEFSLNDKKKSQFLRSRQKAPRIVVCWEKEKILKRLNYK